MNTRLHATELALGLPLVITDIPLVIRKPKANRALSQPKMDNHLNPARVGPQLCSTSLRPVEPILVAARPPAADTNGDGCRHAATNKTGFPAVLPILKIRSHDPGQEFFYDDDRVPFEINAGLAR